MGYNRVFVFLICVGLLSLLSCEGKDDPEPVEPEVVKYNPVDVEKGNPMQLYVHYMPWFEIPSSNANGTWGSHWTMSTRNPDNVDSDGKREIASHYYPQIGPYASGDPIVIEYHLLLMKYSGIEGVLIDWYGASDVYDYGSIRENSEALIALLGRVGLKFAIVYEDRTISAVVDQTDYTDPLEVAKDDMDYIEDNYFNHDQYISIDNRPLFLVFGPEYFHSDEEWSDILSAFRIDPLFLILNGKSAETAPASSGEYIWVNNTSLDYWYSTAGNFDYFMGGAYPGFNDYYEEGGWGDGFNWEIPYDDGSTLNNTLQKASDEQMEYLQLITWNDFGEGTMIEPTLEFGYDFLEIIQDFAQIDYESDALGYIYNFYQLRNEFKGNAEVQVELDQTFYYLVSLQTDRAFAVIDSLNAL